MRYHQQAEQFIEGLELCASCGVPQPRRDMNHNCEPEYFLCNDCVDVAFANYESAQALDRSIVDG